MRLQYSPREIVITKASHAVMYSVRYFRELSEIACITLAITPKQRDTIHRTRKLRISVEPVFIGCLITNALQLRPDDLKKCARLKSLK